MTEPMQLIGRFLIGVGAVLIIVGAVLLIAPKVPFLGKLPGDLHIRRDNVDIYVPLATSLLLSVLLSAGVWLYQYFTKK